MSITKPPVLPVWADAGDKVQPTNAEVSSGWPLSNIPPSRQRFNWILNYLANGVRYFSRRGLPDYDPLETYMIGDCVIGDDGHTYKSLVDNNTANTPSTSASKWILWALTKPEITSLIDTSLASAITPGVIQMWPTVVVPSGYLLCAGAAVSRSTYAALFAVIGTTFGSGDGSTTFNLPNYSDRMPIGKGTIAASIGAAGGSKDATLPDHSHGVSDSGHSHGVSDPGHSHGVYDPGHSHWANSGLPGTGQGAAGGNSVQQSAGSAQTSASGTGIGIHGSGTGIRINSSGSGISIARSGASPTNANLPPYIGINFIIKT